MHSKQSYLSKTITTGIKDRINSDTIRVADLNPTMPYIKSHLYKSVKNKISELYKAFE